MGQTESASRHPALPRLVVLAMLALAPFGCMRADGPTAPPASTTTPVPVGTIPLDSVATEVSSFVTLVNEHRVSLGLAPLIWDSRVAAVAQAHSQDMVDRNYFSHVTPDGQTPWDRLAAAGITYSTAGENIAYGYPTGTAVLAAWLSSAGHKANIENSNFTHHGVGLVGTTWTHMFITPSATSAAIAPAAAARLRR